MRDFTERGTGDWNEIPEIPITDYIWEQVRAGLPKYADRTFLMDVTAGTCVKFGEVENQTRRIASALHRRGFRQGHVLFYVTYELAQLCLAELAVWSLGGAARGCIQQSEIEQLTSQIREMGSQIILVDAETAERVREATSNLEWTVSLVSLGLDPVKGAESFDDLLKDDGSDFPAHPPLINPRSDVIFIPNTSGSTGAPKGVLHTHYSAVANLCSLRSRPLNFVLDFMGEGQVILSDSSWMEGMTTYGIGVFAFSLHCLCSGITMYHIGKFQRESYFDLLLKYKPRNIVLYPYMAAWFARCPQEMKKLRDANIPEKIWLGGWALDPLTAALLAMELPHTKLIQMYGMTEAHFASITREDGSYLTVAGCEGQTNVSSGKLVPYMEAKIMDFDGKNALPRGHLGELWLRSPTIFKGYLKGNLSQEADRSVFSSDNYLKTGDVSFFDFEGNLYVRERRNFMFKYKMYHVYPSEVEAVLFEHEAVREAGVAGIPNVTTDHLAKALVVLKPQYKGTPDLAQELIAHVANRLPDHKQLHGGVRFVTSLPVNAGGKLNRKALLQEAIEDQQ